MGLQRGGILYMDIRQQKGRIAETILTEYLLRRNYYVFVPLAAHGPVDVIAIHPKSGELVLIDAKTNQFRTATDRQYPHRIHRKRKPFQKRAGVRIGYVDLDTREVHIVPGLDKPCLPEYPETK